MRPDWLIGNDLTVTLSVTAVLIVSVARYFSWFSDGSSRRISKCLVRLRP